MNQMDKNVVWSFVRAVRKATDPVTIDGAENLQAYYLDDVTATFDQSGKRFVGLSIDVLGRSFVVLSDLTVAFEDETVENEDEGIFIVEDENIIRFLQEFLPVRQKLLESFGA